jgi:hypothetical protein
VKVKDLPAREMVMAPLTVALCAPNNSSIGGTATRPACEKPKTSGVSTGISFAVSALTGADSMPSASNPTRKPRETRRLKCMEILSGFGIRRDLFAFVITIPVEKTAAWKV